MRIILAQASICQVLSRKYSRPVGNFSERLALETLIISHLIQIGVPRRSARRHADLLFYVSQRCKQHRVKAYRQSLRGLGYKFSCSTDTIRRVVRDLEAIGLLIVARGCGAHNWSSYQVNYRRVADLLEARNLCYDLSPSVATLFDLTTLYYLRKKDTARFSHAPAGFKKHRVQVNEGDTSDTKPRSRGSPLISALAEHFSTSPPSVPAPILVVSPTPYPADYQAPSRADQIARMTAYIQAHGG